MSNGKLAAPIPAAGIRLILQLTWFCFVIFINREALKSVLIFVFFVFFVFLTVKPTAIKNTEEFEGPFKPAKVLKQGSVLDLLKAPG